MRLIAIAMSLLRCRTERHSIGISGQPPANALLSGHPSGTLLSDPLDNRHWTAKGKQPLACPLHHITVDKAFCALRFSTSSLRCSRRSAMKKVQDVMTKGAECVSPSTTLQHAARKMRNMDVGPLPVCDNDRLVGM